MSLGLDGRPLARLVGQGRPTQRMDCPSGRKRYSSAIGARSRDRVSPERESMEFLDFQRPRDQRASAYVPFQFRHFGILAECPRGLKC
jgi:hypothetical protein